jgi:hypothetical protein
MATDSNHEGVRGGPALTALIAFLAGVTTVVWIRVFWPDARFMPRSWRRLAARYWRFRLRHTR